MMVKSADRITKALYELEHGPLAKFALFDDVAALTPWVLESFEMSKAELAKRERKLGAALVQLIKSADWESLSKVVRVVRHFTDRAESVGKNPETLAELEKTLAFFRQHADQSWTLREIQRYLRARTGVRKNLKTLQRWCEDYEFPIKPGKAGRPKRK